MYAYAQRTQPSSLRQTGCATTLAFPSSPIVATANMVTCNWQINIASYPNNSWVLGLHRQFRVPHVFIVVCQFVVNSSRNFLAASLISHYKQVLWQFTDSHTEVFRVIYQLQVVDSIKFTWRNTITISPIKVINSHTMRYWYTITIKVTIT